MYSFCPVYIFCFWKLLVSETESLRNLMCLSTIFKKRSSATCMSPLSVIAVHGKHCTAMFLTFSFSSRVLFATWFQQSSKSCNWALISLVTSSLLSVPFTMSLPIAWSLCNLCSCSSSSFWVFCWQKCYVVKLVTEQGVLLNFKTRLATLWLKKHELRDFFDALKYIFPLNLFIFPIIVGYLFFFSWGKTQPMPWYSRRD